MIRRIILLSSLWTSLVAASPVTINNAANTDSAAVTGHALNVTGTFTPSGTGDVNIKQVNGATVNVGVGAASTGTQRVAVSTDSTIGVSPATAASSSALAANQVVKGSAGTLYSFNVAADSTLSAAAWWVMIYNATSAPADGAVAPVKCYSVPSGGSAISGSFGAGGVTFSTGIVIGVSTNGCFTKAASTHAFISGDAL